MITDLGRVLRGDDDSARDRSTSPSVIPPSAKVPTRRKLRRAIVPPAAATLRSWIVSISFLLRIGVNFRQWGPFRRRHARRRQDRGPGFIAGSNLKLPKLRPVFG